MAAATRVAVFSFGRYRYRLFFFCRFCARAQAPPVTHTVQHTPSPLNGVVTEQLAGRLIVKIEAAGDDDRGGERRKKLFKPRSLGSADA